MDLLTFVVVSELNSGIIEMISFAAFYMKSFTVRHYYEITSSSLSFASNLKCIVR